MRAFLLVILLLPYLGLGIWNGVIVGFDKHEVDFVSTLLNNMPHDSTDGASYPGPMDTVLVAGRLDADFSPSSTQNTRKQRDCIAIVEEISGVTGLLHTPEPTIRSGGNLRLAGWQIDLQYLRNPALAQTQETRPYHDESQCGDKGCTITSHCILPQNVTMIGDHSKTNDGAPLLALPDAQYVDYPFVQPEILTPESFKPGLIAGMIKRADHWLPYMQAQAGLGFLMFLIALSASWGRMRFANPGYPLVCLIVMSGTPFIPYGLYQLFPQPDAFNPLFLGYGALLLILLFLPFKLLHKAQMEMTPSYAQAVEQKGQFLTNSLKPRVQPAPVMANSKPEHPPKPNLPHTTFWMEKRR